MRLNFQFILVLSGLLFFYNPLQADWKSEVAKRHLNERYAISKINSEVVKVESKITRAVKYVNIKDQGQLSKIHSSSMQIFDLMATDTNQFKNIYLLSNKIEVSGALGYPLVICDLNNNNQIDITGTYKIEQDLELANCAIVELQSDSTFVLQKIYPSPDSIIIVLSATDLNKNGLIELNFNDAFGGFKNYENTTVDSYPDSSQFKYRMWTGTGEVGSETFLDLDKDGITDVLYVGDDTLPPHGHKIYVAEYDMHLNNFVQKFRYSPPDWRTSGFSVGDFDNDGFLEFATGSIEGDVFVFENQGNDAYDLIFSDTISTPNAYLTCATNDIDNNGKIEFFLGGSSYYNGVGGTKVYWFEADGNNHYHKKYTFFLSGTDVLGTTELYNYDVNADGVDDLVFAFAGSVVILIWDQDHFRLHYYDFWENMWQEIQSVNIYDLFNDGKPDLLVSLYDIKDIPRYGSLVFLNNYMTGIIGNKNDIFKNFKLEQNFPNPFNNKTIIRLFVKKNSVVTLTVYELSGKEVVRLIDHQVFNAGQHRIVWDGKDQNGREVSSGVYLYRLKSGNYSITKKMLLIR
ncbi:FG-GAP repeat domain-containing protein [Calditrichota bacterium GD2]